MTHTPGPWRVHSEHADRIIVNGCCVYQVGNLAVPDSHEPGVMGKPNPADVRLMAAAPDLLAALQEIAAECERRLRKGPDSGDRQTWSMCRAAIAKAEGRE